MEKFNKGKIWVELRQDLDNALAETKDQLSVMGSQHSTPEDCKARLYQ
jgi:hypothetical protein